MFYTINRHHLSLIIDVVHTVCAYSQAVAISPTKLLGVRWPGIIRKLVNMLAHQAHVLFGQFGDVLQRTS